ncbi:ATP-binding protein [Brasilonema sp. UFV-L1]|uniref:ATP-binding protein n=1 Tax=Brasilonema sp. UFV-L1 TaxID=2234130 RepID=UPI0030D8556D
MKLRSFRLRIALLSAALAGSTLIGFGLVSWFLIYDAKLNRLDAELKGHLMWTGRPRSPERWQSFETLLSNQLGRNTQTSIALLVIDTNDKIVYQSEEWSDELNVNGLWSARPRVSPTTSSSSQQSSSSQTEQESQEQSQRPRKRPPRVPPPPPRIVTQYTSTGAWRVGAITFSQVRVAIAVSLKAIDQEMAVIRNIFLISIPVVLLLVAGGAWGLSGKALYPIKQLTVAIRQVTVQGLDQRVPIDAIDVEFVELIQVFNQMLERLEHSFKQASRFSADAAHELKTPLTILQGEIEQILQQAEPGSQIQQSLSHLLDEVRRLSGIVRKLLLLSLADAGQMRLQRVEVNLSQLLIEMVEDIELLAPQLTLETKIAERLYVQGDRDLLTQILQNLLSNAIKYNLPEGWIRIHTRQQQTTVLVTISNSSKDIPLSDRQRIFDRFYRSDPARTRKVDGVGLGLSLAWEIARAHGGELTLDSTPSGQTAFTLSLPKSQINNSFPSQDRCAKTLKGFTNFKQ